MEARHITLFSIIIGCNQLKDKFSCVNMNRCEWCDYGDGQSGHCGLDTDYRRDACVVEPNKAISKARAKNKIAIITTFNDRTSFYNLTSPIKKAYAKRHGYDYYEPAPEMLKGIVARYPELERNMDEKGPFYNKMLALLMACDNHDWVMWQDADSFFLES